ncbi:uncharacterized protein BDZ99DRAFT_440154 [Mytilinidion resinicola]|uniref:Uncharacterized protein n=1 Tax=Mytilinidion resinicola TaxID=574789 RepID=A0A6A6YTW9_9PEZI|nr:uncharacterized protein BDZ99DRAFT_440154 [Mytilinidion resinicola]KAF2811357.1 hypothetical protein BDZ99DRAFT_440154 [Mytilinidion resinicola]
MANATAESSGAQINPLLRQRMLSRASTFAEGVQPAPAIPRRRSSVLSDLSESRHSLRSRSSTDNLARSGPYDGMENLIQSEEPSHWHSAPLAFAILPAVGGLLFKNGSSIVTDVLLLGLGSLLLNFCVRTPWDWYHAAQAVHVLDPEPDPYSSTIIAEESGEDGDGEVASPEQTPADRSPNLEQSSNNTKSVEQEAAAGELRREEIVALIACFLGPLVGAYLLHGIRSQLTRQSEGLVSNYNLTIFVMAAELRPISHLVKMKKARMLHLQRIVRPELTPSQDIAKADAQELSRRLAEIEERLAEGGPKFKEGNVLEICGVVRQNIQPQLDSLNRAMRRYEKRLTAMSIQSEGRFGELEIRIKDALSLAASAARTGQKPGVIAMALTWVSNFFKFWFQTLWAVFVCPLQLAVSCSTAIKSWFVRPQRASRRKAQTKGEEHASIATSRMHSRSAR